MLIILAYAYAYGLQPASDYPYTSGNTGQNVDLAYFLYFI